MQDILSHRYLCSGKHKTLNIFICQTPFHILMAQYIRDGLVEEESYNLLVDVNGPGKLQQYNENWDEIISKQMCSNFSKSQSLKTQYFKVVNAKRIYKILRQRIGEYPQKKIWFAHLNEFLSNYIFFHYKSDKTIEFNVLQDGILNYFSCKFAGKRWLRNLSKFLLAGVMRWGFVPYHGLINGVDRPEVRGHYLLGMEHLSDYPQKFQAIRIPKTTMNQRAERDVLVLGQESIVDLVAHDVYTKSSDRLMEFSLKLAGPQSQIYYKPHHIDPTQGLFSQRAVEKGMLLLNWDGPIEELFMERHFTHVVSLCSSALPNLKMIFGNTVECWTIDLAFVLEKMDCDRNESSQLIKFFNATEVHLV